ncbi:hypothetical protein FRC07_006790 [Ceratobasidium sp. 392]|nr:hypothetical protein FRC07_006790 [Ceratobasidium sp. 392]
MDPDRVIKAHRRAQETGQSIDTYLGLDEDLCDCDRCYERVTIPQRLATIKKHRQRYGHTRANARAGPSRSRGRDPTPPTSPALRPNKNDLDENMEIELEDQMELDIPPNPCLLAPSPPLVPMPRGMSGSCSHSGSHSIRSRSRSRSRSTRSRSTNSRSMRSRSDSQSRLHSPSPLRPQSPVRSRSHSHSSREDDKRPEFFPINPEEDAAFYARLLEEDEIAQSPPLHPGAVEPPAGGDDGNIGADEGAEGDEGDEDDHGGEGDPNPDEEPGPGPHVPEMFVPPEFGDDPDEPGLDDAGVPAFEEHPVLRNIYLRTWIQAASQTAPLNRLF